MLHDYPRLAQPVFLHPARTDPLIGVANTGKVAPFKQVPAASSGKVAHAVDPLTRVVTRLTQHKLCRGTVACRTSAADFDTLDIEAPDIDNDLQSYQVCFLQKSGAAPEGVAILGVSTNGTCHHAGPNGSCIQCEHVCWFLAETN